MTAAAPLWCPAHVWEELLTRRAELDRLRGAPLDRSLQYVVNDAARLAALVAASGFGLCEFEPGHGGRQLVAVTGLSWAQDAGLIGGSVLWAELVRGRCYASNPGLAWIPEDVTERFGYRGLADAVPLAELLTLTGARLRAPLEARR